MSKFLKVLIALVVVAVMAAPAMAEVKVNGYYRLQGTGQNLNTDKDANDATFVDQRLRMKVTNTLNDNITVVWYGEVDTPWGKEGGKGAGGNGGKLSADGVNVETKNAYVDFKVPDTTWSVRTGVQGYGFSKYEGFVTDDDMNGISTRGQLGSMTISGGWFKWDEGDAELADDADFYMLSGDMKVNDQFSFGLTTAAIKNNMATTVNVDMDSLTDFYYFGANGSYTMDKLGFAASVLFQNANDQENSSATHVSTDGDAMMLNLYAKYKLSSGNVKAHIIYIPSDDSSNGADRFHANNAGWELHADNLMIFGTDIYYNNGSQGGLAVYDSAYEGYGLIGLTVSGDYKLPADSYLKYGVGYFSTEDDNPGGTVVKANDSDLGAEIAVKVGKKFAEKYDLSLRGAYGFMGDFYKTPTSSPDDTYKVVAMLNVSF